MNNIILVLSIIVPTLSLAVSLLICIITFNKSINKFKQNLLSIDIISSDIVDKLKKLYENQDTNLKILNESYYMIQKRVNTLLKSLKEYDIDYKLTDLNSKTIKIEESDFPEYVKLESVLPKEVNKKND